MARLPQPGGDAGNWGNILNDYLAQSHKTDGTLKDNSVTNAALADDSVNAATIADDSVARTKLEPAVRSELDGKLNQAAVDARVTAVGGGVYAPVPVAARNPLTGWWHVEGYGAVGDDSTDDKAAINAAIVACSAAGGGTVYLPRRKYVVSSALTPRSGVIVYSQGASIRSSSTGPVFYGGSVGFSDFTLDGLIFTGTVTETPSAPKRARTTSGAGTNSAISLLGNLDPAGTQAMTNFTMRNCAVRNCSGLPILIKGVRGVISVQNCEFTNNMDVGFVNCEEIIFNGNHVKMSADNGVSLSRGNRKITCTGNTFENCAYHGIWVAGFLTDKGPENVTVTGNTVKDVGYSGIYLDAAPKYGTITSNAIDCGYFRGPSDEPSDGAVAGIFVGGYPLSDRANPTDWATDWVISSNQIRRAPRAGIMMTSVKRVLVIGNEITDTGTQYLADGTTSINTADQTQNVGILLDYASTSSDVVIALNHVIDSRSTPYTNWAIVPVGSSVANEYFNSMVGCRNTYNLIETGPTRNINWSAIFQANTKHTAGATAGSTGGTGTIAAFDINGAATSVRMDRVKTAGVDRFAWGVNGAAESGGNVGSDWELRAYNDAGVYLGSPLTTKRSNLTVSASKGFVHATKAGVPVDGDFATTPSDGTTVLDTANHRLYVRSGGVWKYSALT